MGAIQTALHNARVKKIENSVHVLEQKANQFSEVVKGLSEERNALLEQLDPYIDQHGLPISPEDVTYKTLVNSLTQNQVLLSAAALRLDNIRADITTLSASLITLQDTDERKVSVVVSQLHSTTLREYDSRSGEEEERVSELADSVSAAVSDRNGFQENTATALGQVESKEAPVGAAVSAVLAHRRISKSRQAAAAPLGITKPAVTSSSQSSSRSDSLSAVRAARSAAAEPREIWPSIPGRAPSAAAVPAHRTRVVTKEPVYDST
jgi:hypothetical protein